MNCENNNRSLTLGFEEEKGEIEKKPPNSANVLCFFKLSILKRCCWSETVKKRIYSLV